MIEEYTARLLNSLDPILSLVPLQAYVGTLVGIINSCLFYLVFGRGFKLFPPYLVLGSAAALVGLTVGRQLPEPGPMLGEVSLVAASVSTWAVLFVARSLRL